MASTEYIWDKEKRQFLDFVPPVSILIAGLVFIFGTAYAILQYQTSNGGYDFFNQFFSELGARNNFIRTNNDGSTTQILATGNPEIFNYSAIVAGTLMIPFFPFSYRQMRNKSRLSRLFFIISIIFGTLTGPLLIGVGIFDLSVPVTSQLYTDHHIWAANLYLFISMASIFWLLGIIFSKNLPYHSSKAIFLDYILVIALVSFVLISLVDALNIIAVADIPYVNSFPIEAYQKFIAYTFFVYYALIVGLRLLAVKYDNTPGLRKVYH